VVQAFGSGAEANPRLTALTGIALFVLLGAEGITVVGIHRLLPAHFFIGLLLVPVVVLKMASTGYRFIRYYTGDPAYRRAGPPSLPLRLLAPLVVISTVAVFVSGVELWLFGQRFGLIWLTAHKLSFLAWFVATGAHVLGHFERAPALALADARGDGDLVPGAMTRRSLVGASLLFGIVLALSMVVWQSPFVSTPSP
jgi:hypothetical protein